MDRLGLGLDLGSTSCKATIVNQRGVVLATSDCGYITYSPEQSWREQECNDWLHAIETVLFDLRSRVPEYMHHINLISLTSAAHIGVLLDKNLQPLRRAMIWNDQRSYKQVVLLKNKEEWIESINGNAPSTSWTLPHILWVKENEPEIFSNIKKICLSKDFILHYLTDEFVTDFATAISSQLCDCRTHSWSLELCDLVGIDIGQLPEIRDAGTIVGFLKDTLAHRFGLPVTTPVYNGTLDSAMETYGARVRSENGMVVRIGTGGGIHRITKKPLGDYRLLTYPWPLDNLWYSQAGTNAAGQAIAWGCGLLGFPLTAQGFDAFDDLATHAETKKGKQSVFFHPYLNGERTPYWNSTLRATFSGLSFDTSRAVFAKSILEGVAFSLYDAYLTIRGNGIIPEVLMAVGGGTKDKVLMQILTSVFGMPVLVHKNSDSAYGTALFALACDGCLEETDENVCVFQPDKTMTSLYQKNFEIYKLRTSNLVNMYTCD